MDGVGAEQKEPISAIITVEEDEILRLEARMDFHEKIVRYYVGTDTFDLALVGVLPMALTSSATGQDCHAMFCKAT